MPEWPNRSILGAVLAAPLFAICVTPQKPEKLVSPEFLACCSRATCNLCRNGYTQRLEKMAEKRANKCVFGNNGKNPPLAEFSDPKAGVCNAMPLVLE